MASTDTYTVTVPGKVSSILKKKAKADNVSIPEAILSLLEDAIGDYEDAYLGMVAERNEVESEGRRLYTHEEAWGL